MTGKELKLKIAQLNVSASTIAKKLGISPQALNSSLCAKDVRSGTIERIAQVLNVPVSFLYGEHDKELSAVASGDGSVAVTGNNNVAGNVTIGDAAVFQERVTMLERLLEEKERTIKILMAK